MTHHKTWFPVIVVALSALLGIFIYSVYKDQLPGPASQKAVTAADYQTAVKLAVGTLRAEVAALESAEEVAAKLGQRREALLLIRVPSEYKGFHLEMVMTITAWINALESGDAAKASAAQADWDDLVKVNDWVE